ncbi:MAG: hypothetical protein K8R54_12805 [Bacteroidales bacterium]|nr:hypothetical protein [Bacteroidales bacterium]
MSKVDTFLKSLLDHELAYLYKYRFDTYMKLTQDKIRHEVSSRGLTRIDIDRILTEKSNEEYNPESKEIICPNCKSTKFFNEEVSKTNLEYQEINVLLFEDIDRVDKQMNFFCAICEKIVAIKRTVVPSLLDRLSGQYGKYEIIIK